MSRAMRARLGYFAGVLLIAVGIGLALGLGWGLLAAGVGLVAYTVLLYDVDEPEQVEPEGVRFR
jgi:hypothetical protein